MRRGLGQEDLMHKSFGSILRQYKGFGKLNCSWFRYDASGENRNQKTGALLKAKGLIAGKSDYEVRFLKDGITHNLYLEFKTPTGKQSESQKLFQESCKGSNDHYYVVRSVNEALDRLKQFNII